MADIKGLGLLIILDGYLPSVGLFGHEGVFEAGGESSTSSATKSRLLNLVDDPVGPHRQYFLCLVPITASKSSLDERILVTVKISENAILVLKASVCSGESLGSRR